MLTRHIQVMMTESSQRVLMVDIIKIKICEML